MAARYWVGGAGTWSSTNTTNWSATSGGAGGASVPTAADDVTFDANSGSGVVTFTNGGVTVTSITINKADIELSLGAAFSTAGAFTLTTGIFTTNGYSVSAASLSSSNTNARTISLSNSTVTLFGANGVNFGTAANLIFNAGTSQINLSSASATFSGGGKTFYNVSFTSTAIATVSLGNLNTFNNLTFAGQTSVGYGSVSVSSNQTVNGTFTVSAGASPYARVFFQSNLDGTARVFSCNSVSLTDVDFCDIGISGAAAPASGTRLGDCKGNSGITFDAPKTVYWRNPNSANWGSDSWSLTLGGAYDSNAFPLAQDTAVISSSYPNTGSTITISGKSNIGTLDMSGRTTNTLTIANSTNLVTIFGDWINGTGVTSSGTGQLTFSGRTSQNVTSAGVIFTQTILIDSINGAVTLQDAFTCSRNTAGSLELSAGTFSIGAYTATLTGALSGFKTNITSRNRTLDIGTGSLIIGGTYGLQALASRLTVTGTGTISLTSASAKTFGGGDVKTWPTINQGGTGTLTISGSNKFAKITNTAIGSVLFTGGTTNEFESFNLNGAAGNLLTLGSTNTTQAILKKPDAWNVGSNSADGGNNTNLTFGAGGGIDYLAISYIKGIVVGVGGGNFFAFF